MSTPAPGLAGHPCSFCSRRGVRNDWAKNRARGARTVTYGHPACRWHTGGGPAHRAEPATDEVRRQRSAREWVFQFAPCPRERHLRWLNPVRASCRPDMHLDRPPVLPASVPLQPRRLGRSQRSDILSLRGATSWRPIRIQLHEMKTVMTRPSTGTGWAYCICSYRRRQFPNKRITENPYTIS